MNRVGGAAARAPAGAPEPPRPGRAWTRDDGGSLHYYGGMLEALGPDLWTAQDTLHLPAGVRLPVRMTAMRLPKGGLVVHSPLPLTDDLLKSVARIDAVEYVIAPSNLHHRFAGQWLHRFAGARLYGSPGLPRKRKDLSFAGQLAPTGSEGPPAPWAAVLDQQLIAGAPKLNEVAFFHRSTGTLLVSDLLFNVTQPANFLTGIVLTMMGTKGRLAMSRAWRGYTKDRAALKASLERILAWPFTRILVGHGEVFEDADAVGKARAALAWGLR
jgi:hypothetical protein